MCKLDLNHIHYVYMGETEKDTSLNHCITLGKFNFSPCHLCASMITHLGNMERVEKGKPFFHIEKIVFLEQSQCNARK